MAVCVHMVCHHTKTSTFVFKGTRQVQTGPTSGSSHMQECRHAGEQRGWLKEQAGITQRITRSPVSFFFFKIKLVFAKMSRIFLFKHRAHLWYIFVETDTCFVPIYFHKRDPQSLIKSRRHRHWRLLKQQEVDTPEVHVALTSGTLTFFLTLGKLSRQKKYLSRKDCSDSYVIRDVHQ